MVPRGPRVSPDKRVKIPCVVDLLHRFLTLPRNCRDTIKGVGLSSLAVAINRTDYWNEVNFSPNFTCLGPSDRAFTVAGNPQITANKSSLRDTMELHTIKQPLYTNYLEDGQEYQTDSNLTIRIRIENGTLFFNDAMVLQSNIMYVLTTQTDCLSEIC
jgi:hypothetical protein